MSVLGIAFVVSQFAAGQGSMAQVTSSPAAPTLNAAIALVTATPTPPPPVTPSPSPTLAPTATTATATPSPSPSATTDPMTTTAYSNSGKRYAALRAPIGYAYTAPFAGTVSV